MRTLDTAVDLAGNLSSERLVFDSDRLMVLPCDGLDGVRRQWRFNQVTDVRLEPCVGSCFLQARVDGEWADVLRYPGNPDERLREVADELLARCRGEGRPGEKTPTPSDGEPTRSRRFSGKAGRPSQSTHMRIGGWLLATVRPFWGSMLLLLGLSLAAVAIDVAPPLLQRELVDNVLQVDSHRAGGTGELLLLLLAIIGGLMLVRTGAAIAAIWKAFVSSRLGTTLTANIRNELVQKLNELPLAFHDRNQVGMLMSRVAYDTETLHTLIYHMTGGLLLQALQLLGISVMLFYLNPKLAFITMLPMPLIIAGSWYFTRYLNPRHNHYWEAVGRQASALSGMLSGIRVVKAFVQEDHEVLRFRQSSTRLRDARQTVDVSTGMFSALMGFLFALGVLAVWYLGGRDVLFQSMTLGSLMAFLAYLAMFYTPLTTVAESTAWFSTFITASRRIFEVLDTPSESEETGPVPAYVHGRIEFQGVTFGYDKSRPVLRDVSFEIRPGEMVGVVGRSGSGKSTLVNLLGRLYEVDAGRILIDGHDVRPMNRRQLRRAIGMVLQEPFLFRGTVADNIVYGNPDASPEQILRAARNADAHDFILHMPLAYESHIGESGAGLSGGERQRLSIARALLFDPAILVLDEATASVDTESEQAITHAIRRFARGRTTIVIAHRLSTLRDAHRLLVFDQGRLVEQGTHDELLDQGGLYNNLLKLQRDGHDGHRRGDPSGVASGNGDADPGDELRWLDPDKTVIHSDGRGQLCVTLPNGENSEGVVAVLAFPASHRRRYISLYRRDASGRDVELGLIHSLDLWPRSVQETVEKSLSRRYLLRFIREIRQVRTGGTSLVFSVLTDDGPARFELAHSGEGFQSFGKNGLLLVDAPGSCYVIPDRSRLPGYQQRLLKLYFGD
jgi:ATP-binding cassette subfamily B protein